MSATSNTDHIAGVTPKESEEHRRGRLRVLYAIIFVYIFYYTGRQNFGWAISSINQDLGLTMTQLGWISFGMLGMYGIGQFFNGNLGDKFGGRVMITIGGLFSVILNWITSFGTTFWALLFPWLVNGYAQSMAWAPGSRMLSNWWPYHMRGVVFGWYVFAAGSSSVIIFAIGAGMAALELPWQWMFRLPVLLLAVACIIFYFIARNRPEDVGLPPVEDDPNHKNPENNGVKESSLHRYAMVLKEWRFLLAVLSLGFESLARYGLVIWVPVHLMGPDYADRPEGVWIGVALPVGMALGALTTGYISDNFFKSSRSRPIAIILALAMVSLIGMYFVPSNWLFLGMILLFVSGFLVYGPQACYWALCPDLLGRYRSATAVGVMNMWAYFAAAISGPLIGWVVDHFGTFPVFLLLAGSCALGALLILPVRR